MSQDPYRGIEALLASTIPEELRRGLALMKAEVPRAGEEEARQLCEMAMPIFYIDPLDMPEMVPIIEEAIHVVAGFGAPAIPVLLQNLEGGDVKAQMAMASALGFMGASAIGPVIRQYESCSDLECRTFLLYALGKVKSPEIVAAVPLALEAAASSELELRDTATRAIGKFAESIPPATVPEALRGGLLRALQQNLSDASPGVRSKAVRSLGKLAKHGHLTNRERWELSVTLRRLLGEDEHFEWDRAYVVRKEAKEALAYL